MKQLIDELVLKLFEAERRRLAGVITELNSRNKKLKGALVDGFLYGGRFYLPSSTARVVAGPGQAKPTLDFSLNSEMDTWLKDQKTIDTDHDLVRQMLFRLLSPCQTKQDMRDTLPECLIRFSPELGKYSRANAAGYTLLGDKRAKRQYEKILPRMEFYSTTGLLY